MALAPRDRAGGVALAPDAARGQRPPTVAEAIERPHNGFDVLRLAGALAVVAFHCFALTDRWTDEPLWRLTAGRLNLAQAGVGAFFAISGFLVAGSYERRRSLGSFLAARALRIYPALVVATVFTLVVAAFHTADAAAFLRARDTVDFLWQAATGWKAEAEPKGAFAGNPFPGAVNGSLWTLPVELRLYALCAIAGATGLLLRRRAFNAVSIVLAVVVAARPEWLDPLGIRAGAAYLVVTFIAGMAASVNRNVLRVGGAPLLIALAAFALLSSTPAFPLAFATAATLLVLALALHPATPLARVRLPGDYSYGVYVYSFPLQQALLAHAPAMAPATLFAATLALVVPVAALSWHAIERPMLRLKSR